MKKLLHGCIILIALVLAGTPSMQTEAVSGANTLYLPIQMRSASLQELGAGSASGGGISSTPGKSEDPVIAAAPDGTIYVAWSDDSSGMSQIYMRRWAGGSWQEVGTGSASGGGISSSISGSIQPSISLSPAGIPYAAWVDTTYFQIRVSRFNGDSWEMVGNFPCCDGDGVGNPSIAVGAEETPYLAYTVYDCYYCDGHYVEVWRFDGTNWLFVGGPIEENNYSYYYSDLTISSDGTPFVTWTRRYYLFGDIEGPGHIYARAWTGTHWAEIGTGSASGSGISSIFGGWKPALALDGDDHPYIAWQHSVTGSASEIFIRRFNGSDWEDIGAGSASGTGISNSPGASEDPALAVGSGNVPFVIWSDDSSGNFEIYARNWNGSAWNEIRTGSATGGGISNNPGESLSPSIIFAPDGSLYLAWQDNSSGNSEIYVLRITG